jgi:NAD(P)-dependent dehydrogenase (short-subunit alcohol dehydrogenase family)
MDITWRQGRVAIVTGAGSGIGQATAPRLAAEGAARVGCDVNAAGLEARLVRIGAADGDGAGSPPTSPARPSRPLGR